MPEALNSASEEGTSHLTDAGWAETQRKMDVIGSQLVDLGIAVEAIPGRVASDFADLAANSSVQDVSSNLFCHDRQIFADLLDIQDEKIVEAFNAAVQDQMHDMFSSTVETKSERLQDFEGTEVDNFVHIHGSPVDQDFVGHESRDKQKRQPKAKRHKIQRQHLAAEALDFVSATAIASDGAVDVGVGGVSMSSTSQQSKRQHQPSAQATASAVIASPSQASDESHDPRQGYCSWRVQQG